MIKLSELKDDEMLLVDNELIMTKKEFLEGLPMEDQKDSNVYTTTSYTASLNAKDVLYDALEGEATNMHDNWLDDIHKNITNNDIKEIQIVLDRILERNKKFNVSYQADKEVEIDIVEEEKKDE